MLSSYWIVFIVYQIIDLLMLMYVNDQSKRGALLGSCCVIVEAKRLSQDRVFLRQVLTTDQLIVLDVVMWKVTGAKLVHVLANGVHEYFSSEDHVFRLSRTHPVSKYHHHLTEVTSS
jgi:hypothetical protein